jgi:hypothetical protein
MGHGRHALGEVGDQPIQVLRRGSQRAHPFSFLRDLPQNCLSCGKTTW